MLNVLRDQYYVLGADCVLVMFCTVAEMADHRFTSNINIAVN